MKYLNKIYFGSAGTGKTREAINQAEKIVNSKLEQPKTFKELSTKEKNYISDMEMKLFRLETTLKKPSENTNFINQTEDLNKLKAYPLIDFVTFHPSYSYQDFIEGIRINDKGGYEIQDGIFKKIVNRALKNPNFNYVLIIDEINRGDISAIFGEFFTLLEDSRRVGEKESIEISLPYSKTEKLKVPKNLYVLATMNTVDKSIALIDIALRRRFEFEEIKPKPELLGKIGTVELSKLLDKINQRISVLKNENYQIGHSYFMNLKNFDDLRQVIISKIIPLLQEYFYDDWKSVCAVLNQSFKKGGEILVKTESSNNLFKDEFSELLEFSNSAIFSVNQNFSEFDVIQIYKYAK